MVPINVTPTIIQDAQFTTGSLQIVEWHWPAMIDYVRTEIDLMLEMSLPPHAADAAAAFPVFDENAYCFMGTLFIRYPGIAVQGRSEGGQIRVLRCIFTGDTMRSILGDVQTPSLPTLQGLLDIRSDTLRTLMGLALRELTTLQDRSFPALAAIHSLLALEVMRLMERKMQPLVGGRLAAWQYRRIRERLLMDAPPPSAPELAALCGISVRHLNRQFLALTGSRITDHIGQFWVERAKAMLTDSDMPIKTIAAKLGFAHPNSFARAFRRLTGSVPHSYRQLSGRSSDTRHGPPTV